MFSRFLLAMISWATLAHSTTRQFIILGDTGKNNLGQRKVAEAITRHCQREMCHHGMLAGDNVYDAGMTSAHDPIMDQVFRNYYSHLPFRFFVALGNHDYGKLSYSWERGAYQLEYAKRNPQFILPRYYYYVEFDNVVLVVLDTTRLMWNKEVEQQAAMIQEAYARSQGKWFLVLGHHPYLSNGPHGNAGQYEGLPFPPMVSGTHVKSFIEQQVCGRAHMYISGHDHSLQILDGRQRNCKSLLVISGGGASASEVSQRNQAFFSQGRIGFMSLITSSQSLHLRVIDGTNPDLVLYQGSISNRSTRRKP